MSFQGPVNVSAGARGGHAPRRGWCVAAAVVIAALCACTSTTAARAGSLPKPVISSLTASPASVASAGTTTISASLSGASECTLSSNKAILGLPATFACEGASVSHAVQMPVNFTTRSERFSLKLIASGPGGKSKSAKVALTLEHGGEGEQVTTGPEGTACGVLGSGSVRCWGNNAEGELGNGTIGKDATTPVEVQGIANATQVSAGFFVMCSLLSTGNVDCWGKIGNTAHDTPVEVKGVSDATEVAGTCALLSTGHVECGAETPVEVPGIDNAVQVGSSDDGDACAVLSTGHIECWGANESGQLGNGTTTSSSAPVEVLGITDAIQVSVGGGNAHTCAALATGRVECWGENFLGDLGDGTQESTDVPVEVLGLTDATEVSAAAGGETCARLSNGHIECWGWAGTLAHGSDSASSDIPLEVEGLLGAATQVSVGEGHACAALASGLMQCWGKGGTGVLGNGKFTQFSIKPVEVLGM
jgi:regulator of chromosome condensation (RCC1) repeat-containing protein